jgi:hypothetical protein
VGPRERRHRPDRHRRLFLRPNVRSAAGRAILRAAAAATAAKEVEMAESAWDSFVAAVRNAARDVSRLDVVTLTGDIGAAITKKEGADVLDWTKLLASLRGQGQARVDVKIAAATQIRLDGDTYQIVATDRPPGEDPIYRIHADALAAARDYRIGVLQAFRDLIG